MAEQLTARSGALIATVISVKMEIDDDDRDVIEAEIEVSNEAGIPMGQLEPVVETTEGSMFHSIDPISSIGPGLSRFFIFNFSLPGGEWTFKLWHETAGGRKSLDLGPYHSEFELTKQDVGRKPKTTMGEGLFGGAFNMGMGDFGNVSERGFIDSTSMELVDYEAEHDAGGGTKINVSSSEGGNLSNLSTEVEEPVSSSLTEPAAAQMDQALNTITSASSGLLTSAPAGPPTPPSAPSGPPSGAPESPPSGAPSGPPTPPSAPSGPPSGAPESPPSSAPSGPPTPPSGPPESPPSAAPSGPPTSFAAPSGPPESPPSGAPSGPPTPPSGPPESPPSAAPSGPPTPPAGPPTSSDAPSGPPTPPAGPPESPPSGAPSGPPTPPSGPPESPPSGAPSGPPSAPPS